MIKVFLQDKGEEPFTPGGRHETQHNSQARTGTSPGEEERRVSGKEKKKKKTRTNWESHDRDNQKTPSTRVICEGNHHCLGEGGKGKEEKEEERAEKGKGKALKRKRSNKKKLLQGVSGWRLEGEYMM